MRPGTGQDAVPVVNRVLRQAANVAGGSVRLEFAAGRYDFWPDRAGERYCAISNNTNGFKAIAFPLIGLRDFEIDGGGAAFVFHGLVNPFIIERCQHITLHDFSINWERPFYSQALILAATDEYVDLAFDEAFPHEVVNERLYFIGEGWRSNFLCSSVEFDPRLGGPAYMARDYYEASNNVRAVALDKCRVRLFGGYDGHKVQKSAGRRPAHHLPRPGNMLVMKNDTARTAPGIAISASRRVTVAQVELYHACGMGLVAEKTTDLVVRRVNARLPPGSGRMVSLNADALHFVNCAGQIRVEECVSEYQLDDALNIHGNYLFVTGRRDERTLELGVRHHEQEGFDGCGPGDVLEFHHQHSLRSLGQAGVEAVEVINGRYRLVRFDRPVAALLGATPAVAENISWAADLTITGCRAVANRGRGFLIKSRGKTVIRGNTVSTGGAAIVLEGKSSGFCESGPVRDVLIEDNDFVDCKRGPWGRAVIDVRPLIDRIDPEAPGYHRGVRICNNRIRTFDPGILAAFCVEALEFRDNLIERTATFPPKAESMPYTLALYRVRNARITGNECRGAAGETPWIMDEGSARTATVTGNRLGPRETEPRRLKAVTLMDEQFEP